MIQTYMRGEAFYQSNIDFWKASAGYNWVYVDGMAYNLDYLGGLTAWVGSWIAEDWKKQSAESAENYDRLMDATEMWREGRATIWANGDELKSEMARIYKLYALSNSPDCKKWVNYFLQTIGYKTYSGRANDMAAELLKNNTPIGFAAAVARANEGGLIIVALSNSRGSGHVALLQPGSGNSQRSAYLTQSSITGKNLGPNIPMNWAFTKTDFSKLKYYELSE